MASGTIILPASSHGYYDNFLQAKIDWVESEQTTSGVAPLTSKVTCSISVKKGNDSVHLTEQSIGDWTWNLNIGGTTYSGTTHTGVLLDWVTLASGKTATITHNATTGEATINISGSVKVTAPTNMSLYNKQSSGNSNVTLDKLYVKPQYNPSTITANKSSVQMGSTITFTMNREASEITHDLTLSYGGKTTSLATGVGASYTWTVPDLLDSGITGSATVTCASKVGSTNLGSKSVTFTINPYSESSFTLDSATVDFNGAIVVNVTQNKDRYRTSIYYKINGGTDVFFQNINYTGKVTIPVPTAAKQQATTSSNYITIVAITYFGNSRIGSGVSRNVTLTVSTPTTPTLSTTSPVIGSAMTIYTAGTVPAVRHTIKYSFNGATGTIATNVQTSHSWTLPYDLAKQIRSSKTGTGTISVETYYNGQMVGTAKSVSFTATVPDNATTKPTVSISVSRVQPSGLDSSLQGYYIANVTKVRVDFSASSVYSSITSDVNIYSVASEGLGVQKGNPVYFDAPYTSGGFTLTGFVKDARGYSGMSESASISYLPYSMPRVTPYPSYNDIVCERCTSAGVKDESGTSLHLMCRAVWSQITVSGQAKNSMVFQYRVKEADESWSGDEAEWNNLMYDPYSYVLNQVISGILPDASMDYTVQIRCKDKIDKHIVTFTVSAENTPLHLAEGGRGIGIGMMHRGTSETIDVGWKMVHHTGIGRNTIFSATGTEQWHIGHLAETDFANADTSKVMEYTLFQCVIDIGSVSHYSVLLTRNGDTLSGSLTVGELGSVWTYVIEAHMDASGLTLWYAEVISHASGSTHGQMAHMESKGFKITGLYALL